MWRGDAVGSHACESGGVAEAVDPDGMLAEAGADLADGVEAALPTWVVASVRRLLEAWTGRADPVVMEEAEGAGRRAVADVLPPLRALLAEDVDAQRTGPLDLLRRRAVAFPTELLRQAGVPEVQRDGFDEAALPDDVYDLAPRSFADLDPALQEVGLVWGATKARASITRHRRPT